MANIQNIWGTLEDKLQNISKSKVTVGYKTNAPKSNLEWSKKHLKMINILSYQGNKHLRTMKFHFTPNRVAKNKTSKYRKYWWGCAEKGTLLHSSNVGCHFGKDIHYLYIGLEIGTTTLEINLLVPLKEEIVLHEDPGILLLDIYSKDILPYHRNMCSTVFKAA